VKIPCEILRVYFEISEEKEEKSKQKEENFSVNEKWKISARDKRKSALDKIIEKSKKSNLLNQNREFIARFFYIASLS